MKMNKKNLKLFGYIYEIINLKNGKIYIGQSRNLSNNYKKNYYGSGNIITKAIKKYGKENFKKNILKYLYSKDELNKQEIKYIKSKNSLVPNGYNIREGGNLTGKYYCGQSNPCSKTNMSEKRRKEKGKKTGKTLKINKTFCGDNNPLSIKKYGYKNILIKNRKSHRTAKLRGTDKTRLRDGRKTKIKNNTYRIAAKKAAETMKKSGRLKGKNNPKTYKYKLISPNKKVYIVYGNRELEKLNLSLRILHINLGKGKIKLKKSYHSKLSKNCKDWEIIKLERKN